MKRRLSPVDFPEAPDKTVGRALVRHFGRQAAEIFRPWVVRGLSHPQGAWLITDFGAVRITGDGLHGFTLTAKAYLQLAPDYTRAAEGAFRFKFDGKRYRGEWAISA